VTSTASLLLHRAHTAPDAARCRRSSGADSSNGGAALQRATATSCPGQWQMGLEKPAMCSGFSRLQLRVKWSVRRMSSQGEISAITRGAADRHTAIRCILMFYPTLSPRRDRGQVALPIYEGGKFIVVADEGLQTPMWHTATPLALINEWQFPTIRPSCFRF
jgi:hypothetical protein